MHDLHDMHGLGTVAHMTHTSAQYATLGALIDAEIDPALEGTEPNFDRADFVTQLMSHGIITFRLGIWHMAKGGEFGDHTAEEVFAAELARFDQRAMIEAGKIG